MKSILRGLANVHAWILSQFKVQEYVDIYRTALLRRRLAKSYATLRIQHPVRVEHADRVEMGSDVSIAAFVHIWGGGGVRIGDRVLIGSHTAIASETHDYAATDMARSHVTRPIVISDDVWIGAHCAILPGVTIGKGAVVGAGAVVNKDVEPMSIVAGVPARQIGKRPATDQANER